MTDPDLDPGLEHRLAEGTRFDRLVHLSSCTSTQELALEERGNVCVWSDEQTAGRGRRGRTWDGAPGKDVELTLRVEGLVLPRPELVAPSLPAAVVVALESLCGARLTIKWPNDILHRGRKICGLLIDVHGGRVPVWLFGIGVNVNRQHFPDELREAATSLALVRGHTIDRGDVALRLAASVDRALEHLAAGEIDVLTAIFRGRLGLLGRRAEVQAVGEPLRTGVVTAVDLASVTLDDGPSIPLARVDALRGA